MKYIYHLRPDPFEGTSLIPLNSMDKSSSLYLKHVQKYEGREDLMNIIIPKLNCKWNDVVQFSSLAPQIIALKLKEFCPELKITKAEYFKIPIEDIISKHEAVIFTRNPNQKKGDFSISDEDIQILSDETYNELSQVPELTINYWMNVKQNGGPYLWFPYIPHIFVKGIIETERFEICSPTIQ
jgi:hypothetical protein